MIDTVWAILLIVVGLRISLWARSRSETWLYRMFRARAAVLWGGRADRFLAVSGSMMAAWGLAGLIGIW